MQNNNISLSGFRAAIRLPEDLPHAQLVLRDMLGRVVWSTKSGNGVQLIDVPADGLADGLFLCSIEIDDAPLISKRVMINQ